jgi:hypothetical protein
MPQFAHQGMRYIPDKESYLNFIDYICTNYFQDMQEAEYFFGLKLECDEEIGEYTQEIPEYKGEIRLCPENFPVIIAYHFEEQSDPRGCGKTIIRDIDWKTPEELGIEIAKYKEPQVKKCKWKFVTEHAWAGRRKCREICDGYCSDCEEYWAEGLYLGFTQEEVARYFNAEEREK